MYFTNGINEIRVKNEEDAPEGWVKGRLRPTQSTKGKVWVNDGNTEIFVYESQIPDGFTKGRMPRKKAWNCWTGKRYWFTDGVHDKQFVSLEDVPEGWTKGRSFKASDETKQKLSKSHTGKHHSSEAKKKISQHSNNNRQKAHKTAIAKYGSLEAYFKMINEKAFNSMKNNGTINTSKQEAKMLKELRDLFGYADVLTQYKTKEYPFRCDFYIRSLDLYIELNAHWTHGGMAYDPLNDKCIEKLREWEDKAKTSKFFANAIETWTVRDVLKAETAKKNGLNYIVIY